MNNLLEQVKKYCFDNNITKGQFAKKAAWGRKISTASMATMLCPSNIGKLTDAHIMAIQKIIESSANFSSAATKIKVTEEKDVHFAIVKIILECESMTIDERIKAMHSYLNK